MRSFSNWLNHSFPCFTGSLFPLGISAQIYAQCISCAFPLFLYSVWAYWNKLTELLIVLCTSRCQDRSTFLLTQATANLHLPRVNGDVSWFRNEALSTAKAYIA
jgi:hypothetical protein